MAKWQFIKTVQNCNTINMGLGRAVKKNDKIRRRKPMITLYFFMRWWTGFNVLIYTTV